MSILASVLGIDGIAETAGKLIDTVGKFIPDPNERMRMETEVKRIMAEAEKARFDASAQIMTADANSDSALTRNARPIVVYWSLGMMTLIVGVGAFGNAAPIIDALSKVPAELFDMIKWGVGIFAAGRTVEKTTTIATEAVKAIVNRKK